LNAAALPATLDAHFCSTFDFIQFRVYSISQRKKSVSKVFFIK
jgi:hypothetical protein